MNFRLTVAPPIVLTHYDRKPSASSGRSEQRVSLPPLRRYASVCQTRDPRERSEPPFSELVASPSTDNNKKTDKSGVFSADIEREDLPEKERRDCAQRTTGKGIHFTAFSRLLSGAIEKQPTGLL